MLNVDENYYPHLSKIKTLCVVVVGTADKLTPSFHSNDLIKGIANLTMVKVKENDTY